MSRNTICSSRGFATSTGAVIVSETVSTDMSGGPSEQAGGLHQKDDRHNDENNSIGSLRVEHFGQAFDHTEQEPGDDRTKDRAHPADDDDGEHHDNEVGAHER